MYTALARDASAAAMREVVADIRARAASDEEREELFAALIVLATLDPWGHNLRQEIVMTLEEEAHERLKQTPILGDMIVEAERLGMQQGREEAIAQLLGRLFARRVGRRPTTEEERSLVERARALGAEQVEDALLDLERDALVRWLAEPVSR